MVNCKDTGMPSANLAAGTLSGRYQHTRFQLQNRYAPEHINPSRHSCHDLRDQSCPSGTCHAPTEMCHKKQIQHQINSHADEQKQQGLFAVPNATGNTGKNIVKQLCRHTQIHNCRVLHRQVIDLFRGMDPPQHRMQNQQRQRRKQHTCNQRQTDTVTGLAIGFLLIPGTKALRHRYGKAGGKSECSADGKTADGRNITHGGQRVCRHIAPNNNIIHHIIGVLQKGAEHNRQRKQNDLLHRSAVYKISGHLLPQKIGDKP